MEEAKELEKRVSDLEDYVERLAIAMGKLSQSATNSIERVDRGFNPVEHTK